MKSLPARLTVCALGFVSYGAIAHPGHLDDAPMAHQLSHGFFFALAAIAMGVVVAQLAERYRKSSVSRKRTRND
jgi:hypothetical protein